MATTRKLSFVGTDYTLVLDASFDLYQAGHPNDQDSQDEFTAAYEEAAEKLAEECGINITIVAGNYTGPAMQDQTTNGDEGELWQEIHNRVSQVDGEWTAR